MNTELKTEQLEAIKRLTGKYIDLMNKGDYAEARSVAQSLEHTAYVYDAVWMNGYTKRTGGN